MRDYRLKGLVIRSRAQAVVAFIADSCVLEVLCISIHGCMEYALYNVAI